jgi:hypothetical protein
MLRFVRFLISVLVVVAIVVSPSVAALDVSLSHHSPHPLSHPHRPNPTVLKARVAFAASARPASRSTPETRSRAAKRAAPSSSYLSPAGRSPGNPGLDRVFRALRC